MQNPKNPARGNIFNRPKWREAFFKARLEDEAVTYIRHAEQIDGSHIPQHPLLSKAQWDYLLYDGQISKFTYWSTLGPYDKHSYLHAAAHTIHREEYLPKPKQQCAALRNGGADHPCCPGCTCF